jgi:hypothetical protein
VRRPPYPIFPLLYWTTSTLHFEYLLCRVRFVISEAGRESFVVLCGELSRIFLLLSLLRSLMSSALLSDGLYWSGLGHLSRARIEGLGQIIVAYSALGVPRLGYVWRSMVLRADLGMLWCSASEASEKGRFDVATDLKEIEV